MTDEQIIEGLKDLIRDRESFITEEDSIFTQDKKVLEEAINLIQTLLEERERLGHLFYDYSEAWYKNRDLIQKQQEELEKKDKVLYEMAEWIFDKDYGKNSLLIHRDDYYSNCIKQVIKYFEKKVEENE